MESTNKVFVVDLEEKATRDKWKFIAESVDILSDVTEIHSSCGPVVHITRFPTALLKRVRLTTLKD